MSKIFYDQIIILNKIEETINLTIDSHEDKLELWKIIDNITHNRILLRILEILPQKHHNPFLTRFHQAPFDDELLEYLKEKSKID